MDETVLPGAGLGKTQDKPEGLCLSAALGISLNYPGRARQWSRGEGNLASLLRLLPCDLIPDKLQKVDEWICSSWVSYLKATAFDSSLSTHNVHVHIFGSVAVANKPHDQ